MRRHVNVIGGVELNSVTFSRFRRRSGEINKVLHGILGITRNVDELLYGQGVPDGRQSPLMEAGSGRVHYSHYVLVIDVSENIVEDVLSLPRVVVAVGHSIYLCVLLCISDGLRYDINTNHIFHLVRQTETCEEDG